MTKPPVHPSLESWLAGQGTRPRGDPASTTTPAPDILRAARLGGYAYVAASEDDPAHDLFRPDYLDALARHHTLRRELLPLLSDWRNAGIEVLLFKGFYMGEFVYPVPGARFHGDVDLAIPYGTENTAARIAYDGGWDVEANSAASGRPYLHCAFNLVRRNGATRVDTHRHVLHNRIPGTRVQRRITDAVWQRAQHRELDAVPCRVPAPVDALLILALQRCWGDGWRLKPHDALDMRYLGERFGVDRVQLLERARELNCERTVRVFLEMCDPQSGHLQLAAPQPRTVRRWQRAVLRERPLLRVERQILVPLLGPGVVRDALGALPLVLRTIRRVRRHRDIPALLHGATLPAVASEPAAHTTFVPGADERRRRLVRGVRWCVRILRVNVGGPCLVRSLAIFTGLRARGWPVVFVSGIRRDGNGRVIGHAWVELDGHVLPELREPDNRALFAVNVRHPAEADRHS